MWLLRWTGGPRFSRQVSAQAVELARRCHSSVSAQLSPAISEMTYAEARGYVRARLGPVLDRELARFREQTGCSTALASALRDRAIDELTRLSIGELLRRQWQVAHQRTAA